MKESLIFLASLLALSGVLTGVGLVAPGPVAQATGILAILASAGVAFAARRARPDRMSLAALAAGIASLLLIAGVAWPVTPDAAVGYAAVALALAVTVRLTGGRRATGVLLAAGTAMAAQGIFLILGGEREWSGPAHDELWYRFLLIGCWIVLGSAFVLGELRRREWLLRIAVVFLTVFNIGLMVSAFEVGAWAGVPLYGVLAGFAVRTVWALVPLSVGSQITAGFLAVIVFMVILGTSLTLTLQRATDQADAASRSNALNINVQEMLDGLRLVERVQSDFASSGDPKSLDAVVDLGHDITGAGERMLAITAGYPNAAETAALVRIIDDLVAWLIPATIDSRNAFLGGGTAAAVRTRFLDITERVGDFELAENQRSTDRLTEGQQQNRTLALLVAGGTLTAIVLAGIFAFVLSRNIGRRTAQLNVAATTVASGQPHGPLLTLREGGDDLDALARAFELMRGRLARDRAAQADYDAALTTARDLAEEADRAKSVFLADMSHELRTPLNAILGFSDLLTEQLGASLTDPHRRFFSNIHVAGEHLLGLINDVLDLSKVESGRLELRPEVIEVGVLLEPAIDAVGVAAKQAGVEFTCASSATGMVRVDSARVRQVLFNLLSNAVKFTPAPGSVKLDVRFAADSLVITVSDSGIGIPAENAAKVFGLFERVNRERSDAPGTGLGLALTKRIVELQGGRISFDSPAGQGTTFTVMLPDARYQAVPSDVVLIVEDNRVDAELLRALAAQEGVATATVRTLAEAVGAMRDTRPRGIILDLFLPDGHGAAVLESVRSSPATEDLPVLIVTSATETTRFRLMGAECMTKPIDRAAVRRWLRRLAAPVSPKVAA